MLYRFSLLVLVLAASPAVGQSGGFMPERVEDPLTIGLWVAVGGAALLYFRLRKEVLGPVRERAKKEGALDNLIAWKVRYDEGAESRINQKRDIVEFRRWKEKHAASGDDVEIQLTKMQSSLENLIRESQVKVLVEIGSLKGHVDSLSGRVEALEKQRRNK